MNELTYISVEEAVPLSGLRVAFTEGVPGPWGVGARAILEYKNIPFAAVTQVAGEPNDALQRWTGQNSAPVAVYNEERPRASWAEIIVLAERLAPQPALIPENEDERALMFGLGHEICGEDGLGWNIRVMMMEARGRDPNSLLIKKYDTGEGIEHARARANAILAMLARRLEAQAARGSRTLVGNALSAVDFYWTAFSHLLRGFPETACDMPDWYRNLGALVLARLDPIPESLFEHRDRVLRDHMRCPFKF
jgi:glutathione S-transferase